MARLAVVLWLGVIAIPVQALNRFAPPQAGDRIAIIAPHPDDEVLGTGGLIQQAVAVGAQVKMIYLTNGDHNQATFRYYCQRQHLTSTPLTLGEMRRNEALAAMQFLGLSTNDLTFLGYPDWSTLRLWQDYWDEDDVLYNLATGVNHVPYPEDYGYQHLYRADCITDDLCAVLREFKPTRVFTTHPCDTNPDHRATANFVRLALLQLEDDGRRPPLDFFLVHFGKWPVALQYHPTITLEPPATLVEDWMALPLPLEQINRKYQAILTNLTQTANQQAFLTAFARANELFAEERDPLVPVLPAQAEMDWNIATHVRTLAVLPTQSWPELNAALPGTEAMIGLKCVDFLRQDDALITQVELQHLSGPRTGVRLNLFGYKQGADFASLPKVQINLMADTRLNVLVDRESVEDSGVTSTNLDSRIILRVPLKLLGGADIDHIFATAQAYCGTKIAGDTAWQLLRLQPAIKN